MLFAKKWKYLLSPIAGVLILSGVAAEAEEGAPPENAYGSPVTSPTETTDTTAVGSTEAPEPATFDKIDEEGDMEEGGEPEEKEHWAGDFYAQGYLKSFLMVYDPLHVEGKFGEGKLGSPDLPITGAATARARIKLFWEPAVNWFAFEAAYELAPQLNLDSINQLDIGLSGPDPFAYRAYDIEPSIELHDRQLGESFTLAQNLDRLILSFKSDNFDLKIGRQPIAFGSARVVNPTDLFTPFTYDEIDKEERVGIDAVVLDIPFGMMDQVSLGYIFGEEFDFERSGYYGNIRFYREETDFTISLIGFKQNLAVGFDVARNIGGATAWLETAYTFSGLISNDDGRNDDYFAASVGASYNLLEGWYAMAEYHFNGAGEDDASKYLYNFAKPAYTEGATYLLGRHYLNLGTTFEITPLLSGSIFMMGNLADPSILLLPGLTYNASDNVEVRIGANLGIGENASLNTVFKDQLEVKSEFSLYGSMYWLSMAVYF